MKANVTCSCLEMVMGWVWGDSKGEVEPEARPGSWPTQILWALSCSRTKPLDLDLLCGFPHVQMVVGFSGRSRNHLSCSRELLSAPQWEKAGVMIL